MHVCRKIAIFATLIIMVLSTFSGCILNELFGTNFALSSYEICDDEGFACMSIGFTTTGKGTTKLYGPGNNLIDSDLFYIGNQKSAIYLAGYKRSVKPGSYTLKAYNEEGEEIYEDIFSVSGQDLAIKSASAKWWKRTLWKESYSLVGLNLTVHNSGDTPAYPNSLEVSIDTESITGSVIPVILMPNQDAYIECFVYKEDVVNNDISISLKDLDGATIATYSFSPIMTYNIANKEYRWYYGGKSRHFNIPNINTLYEYYSNLQRINNEDYAAYVFNGYDDDYLDLLVENLMYGYEGNSDIDKVNFAASFVQNLEYKLDSDTNSSVEYARYPIETLFNEQDGGGDCEDLSILMASILDKIGIDVALLRLPNHMAVGVRFDDYVHPQYEYYTEDYYFLESTSEGSRCGYIPSSSKSPSELTVYPISSRPWLKHNWRNGSLAIFYMGGTADVVKAIIITENLGLSTANNLEVKGAFYTKFDQEINAEVETISQLRSGMKKKVTLMCNIPHDVTTTFKTRIYYNNEVVDEHESESQFN